MIDIEDLLTKIITRITTAGGALSALTAGKVFFGVGAAAEPFCRLSLPSHIVSGRAFGNVNLDRVVVQFSVFAHTLTQANNLVKAINVAFETPVTLAAGQINIQAQRQGGRVSVEGTAPPGIVYHASTDLAFTVQN